MPNFKVGLYHEEGGYVLVEAEDAAAAEAMVEAELEENGLDDEEWLKKVRYDVNNREYGVSDVKPYPHKIY